MLRPTLRRTLRRHGVALLRVVGSNPMSLSKDGPQGCVMGSHLKGPLRNSSRSLAPTTLPSIFRCCADGLRICYHCDLLQCVSARLRSLAALLRSSSLEELYEEKGVVLLR